MKVWYVQKGGLLIMSNLRRQRQKEKKREAQLYEKLDKKNCFNHADTTPWQAINNIRNKQKAVS